MAALTLVFGVNVTGAPLPGMGTQAASAADSGTPDTTPPTVSASVSHETWTNAPRVDVMITGTDDSGDVALWYDGVTQPVLGPSPQIVYVSVYDEGLRTVHFSATDAAGMSANGSVEVKIDRSGPSTPTAPAYTSVASNRVNLAWSPATDTLSGVASYDIYDGTTKIGSSTSPAFAAAGLAAGSSHRFSVVALDTVGNASPKGASLDVQLPTGHASAAIPVGSLATTTVVVPMSGGEQVPVVVSMLDVSKAGTLTVAAAPTPPHAPGEGAAFLNQYFDISFDGSFLSATVTLPYDVRLPDARARDLKIEHWRNGAWQDATVVGVDTAKHTVTYTTKSFSSFGLAEPLGVDTSTEITTTPLIVPAYNATATVVAQVLDASGAALPDKKVTIEASRDKATWTAVAASAVPGKPGSYSASVKPISGVRTYLRVRFTGDDFNLPSTGTATMIPKVYLAAVGIAASRTRTTVVSGSISPRHTAAITLDMRHKIGKTWVTRRVNVKANSTGKWSARVTFTPGTWRLRATAPADSGHSASVGMFRTLYVY